MRAEMIAQMTKVNSLSIRLYLSMLIGLNNPE